MRRITWTSDLLYLLANLNRLLGSAGQRMPLRTRTSRFCPRSFFLKCLMDNSRVDEHLFFTPTKPLYPSPPRPLPSPPHATFSTPPSPPSALASLLSVVHSLYRIHNVIRNQSTPNATTGESQQRLPSPPKLLGWVGETVFL